MQCINDAIDRLIADFSQYPNKYLTEDDVRIHLCHLLMNDFGKIEPTKDNDCSISLHTEIRWWGEVHLKYRSDIVFIDVGDLNVEPNKVFKLYQQNKIPAKGYAGNKVKGVIEIKLRRGKNVSDNQFFKNIQKDYNKLKKIKEMLGNYDSAYYIVALDKRQNIKTRLSSLLNNNINVKYKFANRANKNCQNT